MNKRNTRAFAFGIFVAVCIIGGFFFQIEKKPANDISNEKAKKFLEEKGFTVLSTAEYEQMKKTITEHEKMEKSAQDSLQEPEEVPSVNKVISYQLEINSGMYSHDIATLLAEKQIIDDSTQFETYLEEHGYSTKIQLGSFNLTSEMSYKEIAKLITKS
ncbi:cell division protein YceG involved in septum cleavage [Cytobacillus eiseniae]|uniref:Cell division protein YceG involved in septum cleavage n=1 Tax=Cytobacillus eiseniae TaxID=762947 RepID=A0ABS4RFE9_9BACI|nr:endolytic transglycosylase MltG [Cytobacillus eiseniae]MBP2241625.1 cell division protein YceG involved in septum cleavage [Cytobacillus eiseniae]